MTKKDIDLITHVISSEVGETKISSDGSITINSIIGRFMYQLQENNPKLNIIKFRNACHAKPWALED